MTVGHLLLSTAVGATSLTDLAMWDYRGTAPSQVTLEAYHQWLLQWCGENPVRRLVLYVSSPCIGEPFTTFYDPTAAPSDATAPTSFVDFLSDLAVQAPAVEVEVLIDRSSFPQSGASSPCWTAPATTHPSLPLPTGWANLPLAMDWLGTLASNAAVPASTLAGITVDPETPDATPGATCVEIGNHAVAISYQQLIDWIDAWKHANAHDALRSGMTFEVDSATFVKLNVSDLPMPTDLQGLIAAGSPELTCRLGSDGTPNWRPGTDSPLLQSVYLQVYVACGRTPGGEILQASSFWRWQTINGCDDTATPTPRSASDTADALRLNMTQWPGSPGPGTLMAATSEGDNVTIDFTGIDTQFMNWPQYTRVAAVNANGSTTPPAAMGGRWTFQSSTSNTIGTGYGPDVDTGGQQLPYRYSELLMNWQYPYMTSAMTERVWPMFSAERDTLLPFFGYWTEQEFLEFLDAFSTATDGSAMDHAIYASAESTPLAAPPNWGLYNLQKACTSWGIATYPDGTSNELCPTDLNQDGTVGIADLLVLLDHWGTPDGDTNGDGYTDVVDLLLIMADWGISC